MVRLPTIRSRFEEIAAATAARAARSRRERGALVCCHQRTLEIPVLSTLIVDGHKLMGAIALAHAR